MLGGLPATTVYTVFGFVSPPRQYMRVLRLCQKLGATIRANTVVDLSDGSMVNFLYRVDGLLSFQEEFERARRLRWLGTKVAVLPLARIHRSKKAGGRPKELAHLPLLEQTMLLKRRIGARK